MNNYRYLTSTPGIGGELKVRVEDFVVREIPMPPKKVEDGDWVVALVRAKNWENHKLVREFAQVLGIEEHKIGYAGTKDKRAITEQLFSFKTAQHSVEAIELPGVEILETYTSSRKLKIGDLLGNEFEIVVRNIEPDTYEVKEKINEIQKGLSHGFPNYFGMQRFGTLRPITHEVGRCIVKKDFESAVLTYLGKPMPKEPADAYQARKFLETTRNFVKALELYPKRLYFERKMLRRLSYNENYVRALLSLPKNLVRMFIHAYQAYLFNLMLSERLRRGMPLNAPSLGDLILPSNRLGLPDRKKWIKVTRTNIEKVRDKVREGKAWVSGVLFGVEVELAEGPQGEIEREVIEKEEIKADDFVIPAIRGISSKGIRRVVLAPLKNLWCRMDKDRVKFKFELIKGTYATSAMREFMKVDNSCQYLKQPRPYNPNTPNA